MSIYYIKTDEEGYVVDLTAIETADTTYAMHSLEEPVCAEYLKGYYKVIDGRFRIDEVKQAEILAAMPQPEEGE